MTPQLKDIGYASFLNSAKLKVSFKQESKMKIWNRKKKKVAIISTKKRQIYKKKSIQSSATLFFGLHLGNLQIIYNDLWNSKFFCLGFLFPCVVSFWMMMNQILYPCIGKLFK